MPYLYLYRRGERLMFHDLLRVLDEHGSLSVGRKGCPINIDDASIAPVQFELTREGEDFRLTDRSGQGTRVGGKPVDSVLLREGDRIEMGRFVHHYHRSAQEDFDDQSSGGQTLADPFTPAALPRGLWLNAKPREGDGELVRVDLRDKAVIGTAQGCDLVLHGSTVSAHHAEVSRDGDVLRLRDLGSTNGTWFCSARAHDLDLPLDARARIGAWDVWVSGADNPKRAAGKPFAAPGGFTTADPAVIDQLRQAAAVAQSNSCVLITGETGTGKELFARAIHALSSRSAQKYTKYSCGVARSPENFATDLFGHVKGSFTGAIRTNRGVLLEHDGGTVLLDEIGELPLEVQPSLLRALGEHEIQPLGATEPTKVDVRFIAATRRDLTHAVREGRFRNDLFYRLNIIRFTLPPLRQRKADIPLLWDLFWRELSGRAARPPTPPPCRSSSTTPGPATSASCTTSSSAPSPSSARAPSSKPPKSSSTRTSAPTPPPRRRRPPASSTPTAAPWTRSSPTSSPP
jgi:pSer/pThr/pTyr-binding forkhead associated (FHA) protein